MMPQPPTHVHHNLGPANRPPPPGFMMMHPHPSTRMMHLPYNIDSGGMQPQMHMMHAHPPPGMMPLGMQQYQQQMMPPPPLPHHQIPFGRVMVENFESGAVGPGEGAAGDDHYQQQQQQQQDNNNAI